jgi:hypothetical protein
MTTCVHGASFTQRSSIHLLTQVSFVFKAMSYEGQIYYLIVLMYEWDHRKKEKA